MKELLAQLKSINKDNWKHILIQFIKFGIIGVSNAIVSTAIYYLFIWINTDLYFVGNIAGWIVSVFNSFFWNNIFVFRDSQFQWWKKLLRTYIAYGGSFLIGSLLLVLQVQVIGISAWLAPWINLVIIIPLNFIMNKFWAFKS